MIRVLVADDQQLVRSGFRIILEQQLDLQVVGEAATGIDAVWLARALDPDVVLMDVRMPGQNGLEATRALTRAGVRARVLVLTTFDLDEYVVDALRSGASGYLLKDVRPEALVAGVRAAAAGETSLAKPVLDRIVAEYLRAPAPGSAAIGTLSDREREVLSLLAKGRNNPEIAAELFVSTATVKTHVANLLAKLGLRDRVQAVILAYESGFAARDR